MWKENQSIVGGYIPYRLIGTNITAMGNIPLFISEDYIEDRPVEIVLRP